jgi:hypothetical protein
MDPNTRACVAYIASALISGRCGSSVYDYSQSKHKSISGSVGNSSVSIYDHDRGCHVAGSPQSLYDHGRGAHISLQISGTSFTGYDHGSSHHFSGSVSGTSVSIYDHGESSHFSYST